MNVSIKKLAAELDIDYTHLSKIENDHIRPSRELLARLAASLEADLDEWLILAGFLPADVARIASSNPSAFVKYLRKSKLPSTESRSDKKRKPKLPVISLFTGAGGMDLGLEEAGFETVISIEFNPVFRETIRLNRPSWDPVDEFNGDVTKISSDYILKRSGLRKGEAALVVGGAPCQPFSNLGMKKGTKDARGNLFRDFIRIVRDTHPCGFIFENVEGLTQQKHQAVTETLNDAFKDIGYSVQSKILVAADYGVPQKRRRLFVIGCRSGVTPEFMESTHSPNGDSGKKKWISVRQAFAAIPKSRFKGSDCYSMNHSDEMVKRISYVSPGGNYKDLPVELLPNCWKSGKYQGQDTFGRLRWDHPSVTIRTCAYNPTKGRYIHPRENRGLNTIEMAALQSFPHDYQFVGAMKSIGEQIGNAVPPLLARAVGLSMRKAIAVLRRKEARIKKK